MFDSYFCNFFSWAEVIFSPITLAKRRFARAAYEWIASHGSGAIGLIPRNKRTVLDRIFGARKIPITLYALTIGSPEANIIIIVVIV